MPLFKLGCTVTVSAYTEVEAVTIEEAISEVRERSMELSFNGCGNHKNECWLVEEIDGEPTDIHAIDA